MKIIVAPDKFKGSIKSIEVCQAIKKGILEADNTIETLIFPMADGGDGFAEVLKYYLHTETQFVKTVDPLGRDISASYEWSKKDLVAIIELAAASGLVILKKEERNPMITSTFGTGLLIMDAIKRGANKIILGIGGSATNDAGIGILAAMGFIFLDGENNMIPASGENLCRIEKIIPPNILPKVKVEIACDVTNTLYGPEGAAYIFSPQKGATPEQVKKLDDGLKHFSKIIENETGKNLSIIPGTGAAGGIAAGLIAFLNVSLIEGTELIINASCIKTFLDEADFVITGEGKLDHQSFGGKTISAITSIAQEKNIPVAAICGQLELTEIECRQSGLSIAVEIKEALMSEEESIRMAATLIKEKTKSLVPLLKDIIHGNKNV
ncbi:MAG: glycerate kinase [Ginsengibacter sp.]